MNPDSAEKADMRKIKIKKEIEQEVKKIEALKREMRALNRIK